MPAESNDCDDGAGDGEPRKQDYKMPVWELQEDIVVSGFSGRFPESDNVEELKKNLFEGIDMITENDRRWKPGLFGTPKRMGKLKHIRHFDALFFGVHGKQAEMMDPMQRILLEATYEAIFDAGYDPSSLRGTRTGVFMGCSERSVSRENVPIDLLTGYELLGMCTALMANRISFTFDFKGPSITMDTACSSTMHAFNQAVLAMRTNQCDAAIVGGGNISLCADQTISFSRLGLISQDGNCKVFDSTAGGYVRSEAVGAIFLQKASDARRCYATVLHSKLNNDGAKVEGITFPSSEQQKKLFEEMYSELKMDPTQVDYVEAHGTGTVAGDKQEGNAIGEFFCPGRSKPLLVGSVKSNLGHAEAASGTCTVAKVLLSMEEGRIAPNLHYKEPNQHVPYLLDGRMQVITEATPWKPKIAAVNNFGFGGSNVHVVFKANQIEKAEKTERTIPRLVLASGRSDEAVKYILNKVQDDQFSEEALVLLEEACRAPTSGMRYRGFALLPEDEQECQPFVEMSSAERRPVWFLFSGMGSQWPGMAKDMMKLDVFAKSIQMSAQTLKPYGVDLLHLLTDAKEEELNNIITPFVTIAAVQIALVDVVRALNITPDGIIGHSVGELGCAYADGCFTAEQMLKAAYWRGKCCEQTQLIHGAMAAIGLSWEESKARCPEGVFPVCHNAEDSVTISGPTDKVLDFVKELNEGHVFARVVNTCDIAFHSKYVEPASHHMRKELAKVIPNPVARSSRWVSSSYPEERWKEPEALLSSADYMVNNLLSPVLFSEAMTKVPKNAIIIEFAPHSLLQAIVKRILGQRAVYVGLMKKQSEDNLIHCLEAIGKMYTSSLNPHVKNLYSPVPFPVPRGTNMLNSLIKWDHTNDIETYSYHEAHKMQDGVRVDTFRGCPEEYMTGHKVDGRILFPFMGYVWLAWKALANHLLLEIDEVPVVLEDFSVFRASLLPKSGKYFFLVKFLDCDGNFRIVEGGSIVASGKVLHGGDNVLKVEDKAMERIKTHELEGSFTLDAKDFYKELRLRGYEYGPTFQGVLDADATGLRGHVKWEGRWVTFMDAMLQIPILCIPQRALLLPTRVKSIRIDPTKKPETSSEGIPFTFNPLIKLCKAGPVEIQGLHCGIAPRKKDFSSSPVLEEQVFVPLFDSCVLQKEEINKIEEYSHVCSSLAHKILVNSGRKKSEISSIMNGFKEVSEEVLNKYWKTEDKTHSLFMVLKAVLDMGETKGLQEMVTDGVAQYQADIHNDILTTAILNERALRASLDVVQDNTFSTKVKVTEISFRSIIRKDVLRMLGMTTLGLVNFDYTVARVGDEPIPDGYVDASVRTTKCSFKDRNIPTDNDLIVASDIFTDGCYPYQETIQALVDSVKENGFILLIERTHLSPAEKFISVLTSTDKRVQKEDHLEEMFQRAGLALISKKKDQVTAVMYLLRKLPMEVCESVPHVIRLNGDGDFSWVDELKSLLKEREGTPEGSPVWLVTKGAIDGVVGLVNCLKLEPGGKYLRYFIEANLVDKPLDIKFDKTNSIVKIILEQDLMFNVLRDGQLGMFRHRTLHPEPSPIPHEFSFLNVAKRGDLSSFQWTQSPSERETGPNDPNIQKSTLVHVYYSALNFRDVMLASGRLPPDAIPGELALKECLLGLELVGRDESGRRVMGMVEAQGISTAVRIPEQGLLPVPDHWTMEEASTVSVVYMTAYYALIIRGQMQRGESVLVHSGTGGVGQAAINIALSMGCEVFATVGTDEKRAFLKEIFPEVNDSHISSSRDTNFEFEIMNNTNGEGVDLVLNSLAEDKLQASLRCLKTNGRFLEIGKFDLAMDNALGMSLFLKNITFHGVMLDTVLTKNNVRMEGQLHRLLHEGLREGVVKPLNRTVFGWDQAEDAFRFMASGKHTGKVVLKIRDEETDLLAKPVPIWIPSMPRLYCHPHKSYLITGGLGGFGLELANWLVERGAKHITLSTRTGIHDDYQRLWIERWRMKSVNVLVCNHDITSSEGAELLLKETRQMAPVGGIFHLAMVLHDGLFENLTPEFFEEVYKPKVEAVVHLDKLSRKHCSSLDHFVVFSSISGGRGNPGQSNYGYANSAMERVVEQRRQSGLPGLAIQWGGIGDVGVVYEKLGGNDVILKGTIPQRLRSCLEVLDRFTQEDHAVVSSFVPVEKAAFSTDANRDVKALLFKVLGIKDPSSIKPEMTLGELGMDSLMGVEIKQVLESEYDTVLSVPEVRQLSMQQLDEIGKKKQLNPDALKSRTERKTAMLTEIFVPTEVVSRLNSVEGTSCVFFLHPADGHTKMLKPLAASIKKPAYGLQFTDEVPSASVQDIAACYIQHVRDIQPHGPYHLVGFSYGCMIAFEMALQLQKTDQVKTFICIDGSPAAIVELMQLYIKPNEVDDLTLSAGSIKLFLKQFLGSYPKELEDTLVNLPPETMKSKSMEIMKNLLEDEWDEEAVLVSMERGHRLCCAARQYVWSGVFRGRVTFIKSNDQEIPEELQVPRMEDYGLRQVVDGTVEIFTVNCSHRSMGDDQTKEISKIINDRT